LIAIRKFNAVKNFNAGKNLRKPAVPTVPTVAGHNILITGS